MSKEKEEHEALAETLLNLPQDTFDELDDFMSRLSIQIGSDATLEQALKTTNPGLVQMVETMAYPYGNSRLEAIRKWLIYGWPLFKDIYKSRKVN